MSHKIALGVGIDYPRPETIGADRLANATAATALYGSPAVVVDFGTAVTFDVISADRKYIGGVIAPGLNAMTDYLHKRTALLPRVTLREPRCAVGRSTAEAMRSGAVYGYRGLVAEILRQVVKEIASTRKVHYLIATGGDAETDCGKNWALLGDLAHSYPRGTAPDWLPKFPRVVGCFSALTLTN